MRPTLFTLFFCLGIANSCLAQVVIFPGDANNDGKASHLDVLPIGLAYGREGPPRFSPSLNWVPQATQSWPSLALPVSQINLAFMDCDGNGLIDSLDLNAIAFNYDSTQNNAFPPPQSYIELLTQICFSCPPPDIVVTFNQDTVAGLDTFSATFSLRYPPGVPQELGALGIVFDITYDYDPEELIDSLTRVFPDTVPDNRLYIIATHPKVISSGVVTPAGSISFGAAGKGENTYNTSGPLFTVEFIIEDMIVRKGDAPLFFSFKISNVLIINKDEQIILPGKILIDTVVVAAKEVFKKQVAVQISPNPVQEILTIESPESPMEKVEIHSLAGELVLSVEVGRQNRFELPVASLPAGVWLAVVQTKKGLAVKKFVKQE